MQAYANPFPRPPTGAQLPAAQQGYAAGYGAHAAPQQPYGAQAGYSAGVGYAAGALRAAQGLACSPEVRVGAVKEVRAAIASREGAMLARSFSRQCGVSRLIEVS